MNNRSANSVLQLDRIIVKQNSFTLDVAGISLSTGQKLAVIGANGAGKTTLLEGLLGLRSVSTIAGHLLGCPLGNDRLIEALPSKIGIQLPKLGFPRNITTREVIKLHALINRQSRKDLFDLLELKDISGTPVDNLSSGQQRRLDLYLALAHDPEFAILDEPTAMLDATFQAKIVKYLSSAKDLTLLYSTHIGAEFNLADQIMVLHEGRAQFLGSLEQLRMTYFARYFREIALCDAVDTQNVMAKAADLKMRFVAPVSSPNRLVFFTDEERNETLMSLIEEVETLSVSYGVVNSAVILDWASNLGKLRGPEHEY